MKYFVRLHRIRRSVDAANVYIEAPTEDEAQDLALESDNLEWDELQAETENVAIVDCTEAA